MVNYGGGVQVNPDADGFGTQNFTFTPGATDTTGWFQWEFDARAGISTNLSVDFDILSHFSPLSLLLYSLVGYFRLTYTYPSQQITPPLRLTSRKLQCLT